MPTLPLFCKNVCILKKTEILFKNKHFDIPLMMSHCPFCDKTISTILFMFIMHIPLCCALSQVDFND